MANPESPYGRGGALHTALGRFLCCFLGVALAITLAAWIWRGIDFTLAVLLGCGVVGFNGLWTRNVLIHAATAKRGRIALVYVGKFGVTAGVLALAILHYGLDALGVLVGVSALPLAVFLCALWPSSKADTKLF